MSYYEVPRDVMALDITDEDLRQTPKPVIVNVVGTYDLSNSIINTELLTLRLPGFGFNPHRFAAAKMRLPRAMTLAFCGGRAVCPGSRSVMQARIAALRFTDIQLRAGEYVQFRRFRVENIVMSVWAPFEIALPSIVDEYSARAEYSASKFPGLSFRMGVRMGVVCNVFVTGRCVITGSKNEELSYRTWWWLYTRVLVRHKLGSAAGTTSSAAYRMSTFRRRDTFANDCERISSRHSRREDGPMAQSVYGDYLAMTPRMTPMHVPATPRDATPRFHDADVGEISDVQVYFERMNMYFGSHSVHCPFVCANRARERLEWHEHLCAIERAAADTPMALIAVLAKHVAAQCVSSAAFIRTEDMRAVAARYQQQLSAAIGVQRLQLTASDGDGGPFRGHSVACPFLARCTRTAWEAERHRLEVALAGGVDADDYSMDAICAQHTAAGCTGFDVDDASATPADTIRWFIVQLHTAAGDFEDSAAAAAASPNSDENALDDSITLPATTLSLEDVQDYEARYRLDAIREQADIDFGVSFAEIFEQLDGIMAL